MATLCADDSWSLSTMSALNVYMTAFYNVNCKSGTGRVVRCTSDSTAGGGWPVYVVVAYICVYI